MEERKATGRVEKIMETVRAPKIVFSVEKATLFTEAYQKYEGTPNVIRMAKAQAYMLDHIEPYGFDLPASYEWANFREPYPYPECGGVRVNGSRNRFCFSRYFCI